MPAGRPVRRGPRSTGGRYAAGMAVLAAHAHGRLKIARP